MRSFLVVVIFIVLIALALGATYGARSFGQRTRRRLRQR